MSLRVLAPSVLAAVCLFSGCMGSSRSKQAAEPEVEPEPVAGAEQESGIPGLTVAEVNAMPEAPPLPSSLNETSLMEDVEVVAAETAAGEAKRGELGDIDPDKRTIYLTHVWWQEVRTLQRGMPSEIPGLTVGEVEDQPTVPGLAELYDLRHSVEDLRPHAYVTALEEEDAGIINAEVLSVEARTIYLVWAWTPLLHERQDRYRKAEAERAAGANYRIAEAKRKAEWEAQQRELRREVELDIERSKRETIPVLTPEEEAELARFRD